MNRLIKERYHVACKQHVCMACEWFRQAVFTSGDFTIAELRAVAKAKANGWKIQPGEKYLNATLYNDDHGIHTFKAIIAIDEICLKFDLYKE